MSLTPELLADFTAVLPILGLVVASVCSIIILIAAFQTDTTTGLYCLLCFPYMLYFALSDFEHDWKWAIIGGWLCAGAIAASF